MGILFSKFRIRSKLPPKEIRVLLLGLNNSGKTTTLYKLKLGKAEDTVPTVGFNVETIKYKHLLINTWDIGGQERLRALWRHYIAGTDVLIFVLDSADTERLAKAKEEFYKMLTEKELESVNILVLANKQDLKDALTPDEIIAELELRDLKSHQWRLIPTVATTGSGLPEILNWIYANYKK